MHCKMFSTALVILSLFLPLTFPLWAAETLEQSIAAAKKESELYFVAGPTTFGGKKGSPISKPRSTGNSALICACALARVRK